MDDFDLPAEPENPSIEAPEEKPTIESIIRDWYASWYPDPAPNNHPVKFWSDEWHHARSAFHDLLKRIS